MEKEDSIIEERTEIRIYQKLKDEAQEKFNALIKDKKENISLSDLKKILNIYDIDPNINNFYLEKCLELCSDEFNDQTNESMEIEEQIESKEISVDYFIKNYLYYINSLSLSQKKNLNKKIEKKTFLFKCMKGYLNDDSNIKKIFDIILHISANKKNLKNLFESKYFVNIEKFHIPLKYGTNELKYASFLSDINSFLFENFSNPKKSNSRNNYLQKIKQHDVNIIKKITNQKNQKEEKITQDKNEIIINKKKDKDILSDDKKKKISNERKKFLQGFFNLIFDENATNFFISKNLFNDDDLEKFNKNYILNNKIDFTIYNLLYIDLIMYCYLYYPEEIKKKINKISKLYESDNKKKGTINNIKKIYNIQIINNEKAENYLDKVIYKCINKENDKESFEFNPNEYIMEDLIVNSDFNEFRQQFEEEKNFTLFKHYKNNSLFQKSELNNEYKNNLFQTFTSNIMGIAFDEFRNFKQFKNPFQGENKNEFFEEIDKSKYYIYFPILKISGLTFKNIGIIFINKNFKNFDNVGDNKLINFSINVANKKITECHEVATHYMSVICKSNDPNLGFLTPNNTFINYDSDDENYNQEYDGGDKLETFLFGNKIILLTIQSALFILDEKNWTGTSIEDFRATFIKYNKLEEKEVDFSKQSKIIELVMDSIDIIKPQNKIQIERSNTYILFRKSKEIKEIGEENIEDINNGDQDEEFTERFSITSNIFLPKKLSISEIMNKIKKNLENEI